MFINQSFVAIIFKLINFFAIIGLGFYIFKKYLKTDLLFSIVKKETDHQDLLTKQTMLENKQRNLDLLIKEEAIQCQNLQSKIDEWNATVLQEQDKQEKEQSNLAFVIKKRKKDVAVKKENQRVQSTILNGVIANLENSLSNNFKDSKKGTDYLNAIVHFMNEKIS